MKHAFFVLLFLFITFPALGIDLRLEEGDGLLDALVFAKCDFGWLDKIMEVNDIKTEDLGLLRAGRIITIPDSLIGQEPDLKTRERSAKILAEHEKELHGTNGGAPNPQESSRSETQETPESASEAEVSASKEVAEAKEESDRLRKELSYVRSEARKKIQSLTTQNHSLMKERDELHKSPRVSPSWMVVIMLMLFAFLIPVAAMTLFFHYYYSRVKKVFPFVKMVLAPVGKWIGFKLSKVLRKCAICGEEVPEEECESHLFSHKELREPESQPPIHPEIVV